MSSTPIVRHISTCTIRAQEQISEDKPVKCTLTSWDLAMLSVHYIQKGLLFYKPSPASSEEEEETMVERLKHSLSQVLVHFFPLAGRLATQKDSSSSFISIDCSNQGAKFIHAIAENLTVADILTPSDVPHIVTSFFPLDGAVNHDGHSLPLLAVQLTELVDGVFLACSFNHSVGDGTSFWQFFSAWSEISRGKQVNSGQISHPPIIERWFLPGIDKSLVRLPFSDPDEFIERYSPPLLRERIFHFTQQSMSRLKRKANAEQKTNKISSFQALSAHLWRAVTRSRSLPIDQKTSCRLACNNRTRLDPPLSPDYFGNCIQVLSATATVGDLMVHDLGWAASMLHQSVVAHNDSVVKGIVDAWIKRPQVYHLSGFDPCSLKMGSCPRFDMYGNDFGWGKAVGVRSGSANKFDGKISSYPGVEGGGSVDLEVCLLPEVMSKLELDEEFVDAFSP